MHCNETNSENAGKFKSKIYYIIKVISSDVKISTLKFFINLI